MLRDKRLVGRQFSRAAKSYEQAASLQAYAVNELLRLLRHQPMAGHWLDIGCGTGIAFDPLLKLGVERISGIDLAPGMLEVAGNRHSLAQQRGQLELLLADSDELPFPDQADSSVHPDSRQPQADQDSASAIDKAWPCGILSSLMLQWSETPERTLMEWARVLPKGGLLAVATLLPGTHQEIADTWASIDQYRHVNRFTPLHELLTILDDAGFLLVHQHAELKRELYPDVTSLLKGLKSIGATNVNSGRRPGLGGRKTVRLFEQHYPKLNNGYCPLSYQLCWVIARKH